MPKISVLLTSYNHESYLRAAIDSVLSQTFTDFELIIVDDCSSDSSWDIIQSYKDSRIIPVRHELNQYPNFTASTDNLRRCKGQYLAIHHSDDEWLPDKLKHQAAYLDAHPETTAVFTWVQFIDEQGRAFNPAGIGYHDGFFDQPNRDRFEWLRILFYEYNKLCHPSILIRMENYYYLADSTPVQGLAIIPDYVKWIRLCLHSNIHIIPERLTRFRLRDNRLNTSVDNAPASMRIGTELYLSLREFLSIPEKDFCDVFPEAAIYQTSKGLMVEYAFARLCLEREESTLYPLFGMEMLYKLINTPEKAVLIEEMYGFTSLDFSNLTKKHDIFNRIAIDQWQICSLYIDFGEGFLQQDKITKKEYLPYNRQFTIEFDLSAYQGIKSVRFCPQEGFFSRCRIQDAMFDGHIQKHVPVGTYRQWDGFDLFSTIKPLYHIEGSGKKFIISGEVHMLSHWHISNFLINPLLDDNKQKIIYGAGSYGERAFNYYGNERIYAFADMSKSGNEFLRKPVIHPSELTVLSEKYDIIICVKKYDDVVIYLNSIGVNDFNLFFEVMDDVDSR